MGDANNINHNVAIVIPRIHFAEAYVNTLLNINQRFEKNIFDKFLMVKKSAKIENGKSQSKYD